MTEKRFVLERSEYDLKYEFSIADTSKVEKTKEDFWNDEEEIYEYHKYIDYLLENDSFLTLEEADELLNALHEENKQLKQHIQTLQKQTKRLENDNIQTYTLIKEALANERTQLGQSVLKQLMERIQ